MIVSVFKLIKSFWSSFLQKAYPQTPFKGGLIWWIQAMIFELTPRILSPLKVFVQTFYKKFVGVLGVKPLTLPLTGVWGQRPQHTLPPCGGMGATPPTIFFT